MISDEELAKIVEIDVLWPPEKKIDISRAEAMAELQRRRESELRPATKYLGLTKSQQYKKIIGEVTEFSEALDLLNQFPSAPKPIGYDSARIFVLEELVDVQTACETMMAILGAGEKERNDIRRQVIEKNRRRGYYEGAASNK